jgi:hypothetical protein
MTQERMLKQIEFMTQLLAESKPKMTYSEAIKKEERITNKEIIMELQELRKKQNIGQTAVNFLYNEIQKYWYGNSEYESSNEIIEKAKQIEKENTIMAFKDARCSGPFVNATAEEYYNETYNK